MQKKWMILTLIIIIAVVIIGVALSALAQDNQATQPVVAIEPPAGGTNTSSREIFTALAVGDSIFEPESWLAGAQELADRTIATWASESLGGTSLAEYLHFDGGYDQAAIVAEWFNNDWFTSAFSDFSSWTPQGACATGSTTLYEFTLVQNNANYVLRYWVKLVSPNRILAFQILFPEEQAALLEQYAQRYDPALYNCP